MIKKRIFSIFLMVSFVVSLGFFVTGCTGQKNPTAQNSAQQQGNPTDTFAQCLTENGAKFYGAYWCPHCQNQKTMFGESVKYITYIECALPNERGQTPECTDAGIEAYPTWTFADGTRKSGELTLAYLAEKTGCQTP